MDPYRASRAERSTSFRPSARKAKDRITEKPGSPRAFWNAYLKQANTKSAGVPVINKDMSMKKYARVVDGKVDNIYETVNPITEEFPADQLWIDVAGKSSAEVDYDYNAVNTDGLWSFNSGFPWPQTALAEQMRIEKGRRLDSVMTQVASSGLQFKVDLGVATAAEQAYLIAFKEYCVAFTQVNKQPAFPLSIVWPELP
jgi:hypothetical protein